MRRIILGILAVAVCGAMQLFAQQQPLPSPPGDARALHAGKLSGTARTENTPEASIDATRRGSPLPLDKGWRVGITADPAAAAPEFDDSGWAVRDAQPSFAEVPGGDDSGDSANEAAKAGQRSQSGLPGTSFSKSGSSRPEFSSENRQLFAWFRIHLQLAPNHGPLSLLIELPVTQNINLAFSTQPLSSPTASRLSPRGQTPPPRRAFSRSPAFTA